MEMEKVDLELELKTQTGQFIEKHTNTISY